MTCVAEKICRQTREDRLKTALNEAERKAWDALSRSTFQMFGYWAAIWVHLNRIGEFKRPNPWTGLVMAAREKKEGIVQ
jgi:hypothetical protein